jgi:hypothetical protein
MNKLRNEHAKYLEQFVVPPELRMKRTKREYPPVDTTIKDRLADLKKNYTNNLIKSITLALDCKKAIANGKKQMIVLDKAPDARKKK